MEAVFDAAGEIERLTTLPRDPYGRLDVHRIDSSTAIDALERLESLVAHLHALQADLLVAAAGLEAQTEEFAVVGLTESGAVSERRVVRITDASRDEIAATLRWSSAFTHSRIDQARLLHTSLPGTFAALRQGEVSVRHASAIVETAARFSHRDARTELERSSFATACAALESRVLATARRSTVARTVAACRRAAARIDRDHQRRRALARRSRDVTMYDDGDGIACVLARLSTPAAHALLDVVRTHSLTIDDPALTQGERRAQALMSLVFGDTAPAVRLNVVLSSESASPDNAPATVLHQVDWIASLRGTEVDPASLLELLADPQVEVTLRKLLADDITGQLSGCGRTSYRLPSTLREFIVQRDQTCRFPGCGRRAEHSQVDHAIAWDAGGTTDADNLGALCTRHHQLKTHGGWCIVASEPDGSCTWQSPQGRRYRRRAPAVHGVPLEFTLARSLATARVPRAETILASVMPTSSSTDPPPF